MALLILSIFGIIFRSYILQMVICTLGIFLFGVYLIFDTQLIMGGKRYELCIDDYVVGALILYLDIIMIFLYLL